MKTINNLTHGSLVRVSGLPYAEVTIRTLAAFAAKHNETVADCEARDRDFGRPTEYAWTMKHAGVLESNYLGKAEARAKKCAAINAAPEIETGDILVIDGSEYTAEILGNYSDPVRLERR